MASLGSEDAFSDSGSDIEQSEESDSGIIASTHCKYLPKSRTAGRRRLQETSESSSDEEQLAALNKDKYTVTPVLSKDKPTESSASRKDKHTATPCRKGKEHSDIRKRLAPQSRKVASLHPTPSRVVGRTDPL